MMKQLENMMENNGKQDGKVMGNDGNMMDILCLPVAKHGRELCSTQIDTVVLKNIPV